jgi:tryptophan halogenase
MKIVIIGGGSSGWITALAFYYVKTTNPDLDITLIESPVIKKLAVGESTFPSLATLLHEAGIDEDDMLKKCNGTYKWGTKFSGFQEYDYYHPVFGMPFIENDVPMDNVFIAHNKRIDLSCIGTHLMQNYRKPIKKYVSQSFLKEDPAWLGKPSRVGPYAFHFDINKFVNYVKDFLAKNDTMNVISNTVVDVERDDSGNFTNVVCKDGLKVSGDFFVDCSGFSRLVFGKILKEKFISFKHLLPVDYAIPFTVKNEKFNKLRKVNVTATTHNSGWAWEIPLRDKTSRGYVYGSDFTTEDEVVRELEEIYGKIEISSKPIDLKTGVFERSSVKNMAAVGLSSGFIEPLESNATTITTGQANYLAHLLSGTILYRDGKKDINLVSDLYNKHSAKTYSHFLGFIKLHYANVYRNDTKFWKHVQNDLQSFDRLNKFLDDIKYNKLSIRLPDGNDFYIDELEEDFGLSSWLLVLQAVGLIDSSSVDKKIKELPLKPAEGFIKEEIRYYINLLKENRYE